jgi:hypothetical protein
VILLIREALFVILPSAAQHFFGALQKRVAIPDCDTASTRRFIEIDLGFHLGRHDLQPLQ